MTDSLERWNHKVHMYLEYYSVCPLVRIGTPTPGTKGGGQPRLWVRGWWRPISDDCVLCGWNCLRRTRQLTQLLCHPSTDYLEGLCLLRQNWILRSLSPRYPTQRNGALPLFLRKDRGPPIFKGSRQRDYL
jgi:hypothetical protein